MLSSDRINVRVTETDLEAVELSADLLITASDLLPAALRVPAKLTLLGVKLGTKEAGHRFRVGEKEEALHPTEESAVFTTSRERYPQSGKKRTKKSLFDSLLMKI